MEAHVLQELLSIFRSASPLQVMADQFAEMLTTSLEMVRKAGAAFAAKSITAEERTALQQQDVRVNKLQRRIRKQVILHLSIERNTPDLPYCLLLMNLVKDVERIGDYAKELADLVTLSNDPLPSDALVEELKELRAGIETDYVAALKVIQEGDRERAVELIQCGKDTVDRCEALTRRIANGPHNASVTATLVLAVRFYQRIAGHVLNLLSSAVVPLHKLDYYDEKDIAKSEKIKP